MIGSLLLAAAAIAAGQDASAPAPADEAEFRAALECRAYTQMLPSLGEPDAGRRIHRHWVSRSETLGARRGLDAKAVDFQHLLIEIKPDVARAVLPRCVEATPKAVGGLR